MRFFAGGFEEGLKIYKNEDFGNRIYTIGDILWRMGLVLGLGSREKSTNTRNKSSMEIVLFICSYLFFVLWSYFDCAQHRNGMPQLSYNSNLYFFMESLNRFRFV